MPKMKYFQPLADIRTDYERILKAFDSDKQFAKWDLESWGVTTKDKPEILDEYNVLRYLIACQHGVAYHAEKDLQKPSVEVVNRCFKRQIAIMEDVFGVDEFTINQYHNPIVKKKYQACKHYIFKFSLNGWVKSMPAVIEAYPSK